LREIEDFLIASTLVNQANSQVWDEGLRRKTLASFYRETLNLPVAGTTVANVAAKLGVEV
jgi:hypothetical protein